MIARFSRCPLCSPVASIRTKPGKSRLHFHPSLEHPLETQPRLREGGSLCPPEHHLFSSSTKTDPQRVTKLLGPRFWEDLRKPLGGGGGSTGRGARPWARTSYGGVNLRHKFIAIIYQLMLLNGQAVNFEMKWCYFH